MPRSNLEVLAPAGDAECLEAAVRYGADAVYLGGKMFGMRASPKNFDDQGLRGAVSYCHKNGVKIYIACNVLPRNSEIDELREFIRYAGEVGADALIVADIGVLLEAKRIAPDMEIHISTQAGVVNYLTATELYHMGAGRVVLARELSLEDIAVIRDKTPAGLDIECFVHGAMCMSFSGRCLISQYLTGRDANHGECSQPCRWAYHLMEEKRKGQFFPVFEDECGSYILNAKDLSMLPYIDKLAKVGVSSLKIEGRAKSSYYVAVITNAYRQAVDLYCKDPDNFQIPQWLVDETKKISHREYSTGFYFPENMPDQYYQNGGYVREWDVAAIVEGWENEVLYCSQRSRFFVGDEVEILVPKGNAITVKIETITGENGELTEVARHPMEKLRIPCTMPFPVGSIMRKRKE